MTATNIPELPAAQESGPEDMLSQWPNDDERARLKAILPTCDPESIDHLRELQEFYVDVMAEHFSRKADHEDIHCTLSCLLEAVHWPTVARKIAEQADAW